MSDLPLQVYAHSPSPENPKWHPLVDHLSEVARLGGEFAQSWGDHTVAKTAGLWHDIGKFNPAFQAYLRASHAKLPHQQVPHAIWGAVLAAQLLKGRGAWKEIALAIAGHHTGIPAGSEIGQMIEQFSETTPGAEALLHEWVTQVPPEPGEFQALQVFSPAPTTRRELFIRMGFSALVDADYLDAESHFKPSASLARLQTLKLAALIQPFFRKLDEKTRQAPPSAVNDMRREVAEACQQAGGGSRGIYRLTVPTGGGKTLAAIAFALRHAVAHPEMQRIIVAAPYTSIIDQTVDTYREIFGDEAVLEHHSQAVPPEDDERQDLNAYGLRFATENWDHPLVVTTTVQLFESLFSNRPGKTRKLHNLARSIIVIDEVQTLPPELLEPTLDVLKTLAVEYGTTVVLSTATQPTFEAIPAFSDLPIAGELVPTYPELFRRFRRVNYEWRDSPVGWESVADAVRTNPQIMVILNTRQDATTLLGLCKGSPGLYHLSALLCGKHRRDVLSRIRAELKTGPVRLISTQVVEAGVDLDFPVVWRALGPLDRIVQAAGRCNREGRPEPGSVVIFEPAEGSSPTGSYRIGIEEARLIIQRDGAEALHRPEVYETYFRRLFASVNTDAYGIQSMRRALNYPKVAAAYRLIREPTVSVVVPYQDWEEHFAAWQGNPGRATWRRLQPYLVSLYRYDLPKTDYWLEPVSDDLMVWRGPYNDTLEGSLGLPIGPRDPNDFVI